MNNKPALIITIVVAILAAVAVIFAFKMLDSENDPNQNRTNGTGDFIPGEELETEAHNAAKRLVRDNHDVFKLFYLREYTPSDFMPEPYGNVPEDGYYTLKVGTIDIDGVVYDSIDRLFKLVDDTFVEAAAEEIKNYSTLTDDNSPVYKERDDKIGVNASFSPMEDYDLVWDEVSFTLTFISENECTITATLKDKDGKDVELQKTMRKEDDDIWRLENIFYQ